MIKNKEEKLYNFCPQPHIVNQIWNFMFYNCTALSSWLSNFKGKKKDLQNVKKESIVTDILVEIGSDKK